MKKRILCIVLAVLLVLALCGCGTGEEYSKVLPLSKDKIKTGAIAYDTFDNMMKSTKYVIRAAVTGTDEYGLKPKDGSEEFITYKSVLTVK